MSLVDYILILIIVMIPIIAFVVNRRRIASGKTSCCAGCNACSSCNGCMKKTENKEIDYKRNTMGDEKLKWKMVSEELLLHTPVYDVYKQKEISATGIEGNYIATQALDWATIIPIIGDEFLMVRQWRHSSQSICLEFPGGVCDFGEDPCASAARELEEETGYRAGKVTKLGSFNPNPALFRNRTHCFLAEELVDTGRQALDDDEVLEYVRIPIKDVYTQMGDGGEFDHALMAAALALYMAKRSQ